MKKLRKRTKKPVQSYVSLDGLALSLAFYRYFSKGVRLSAG